MAGGHLGAALLAGGEWRVPGTAGCLCSSYPSMGGGISGHLGTRTQKGRAPASSLELANSFHEGPVEDSSRFPEGPPGLPGQQGLAVLQCGVSVDRMCDEKAAWSGIGA